MIDRYELRNRYLFTGKLVMQTAFHIGGGKGTLSSSDSPVVLTPEGYPFIPGSSFKGVLRSSVEKIVPMLPEEAHLFTCGLIELDEAELQQARDEHRQICSTARQNEITKERRNHRENEKQIMQKAIQDLCHTCQLFGSPYTAARLSISDLYLANPEWKIVQQRDGVAIDRDSEKARDALKYDFEVVPASTIFNLRITLENATDQDLQLLCVGLSEFINGFGFIGGKRSRGLGACKLDELKVSALDLINAEPRQKSQILRNYLLRQEFPRQVSGQEFIEEWIDTLFSSANNNSQAQ